MELYSDPDHFSLHSSPQSRSVGVSEREEKMNSRVSSLAGFPNVFGGLIGASFYFAKFFQTSLVDTDLKAFNNIDSPDFGQQSSQTFTHHRVGSPLFQLESDKWNLPSRPSSPLNSSVFQEAKWPASLKIEEPRAEASMGQGIRIPLEYNHLQKTIVFPIHVLKDVQLNTDFNDQIPCIRGHQFVVKIRFTNRRPKYRVICFSGPQREHNLPVFQNLSTLSEMKQMKKYQSKHPLLPPEGIEVFEIGGEFLISIKRYESRLTLVQMAYILGLQNYKISLTRDIESVILDLCEQLGGFKIGVGTWNRGVPRIERELMVIRVHKFAREYFPTFSRNLVETIIKRGAYARTQEFLRRKRRRHETIDKGARTEGFSRRRKNQSRR